MQQCIFLLPAFALPPYRVFQYMFFVVYLLSRRPCDIIHTLEFTTYLKHVLFYDMLTRDFSGERMGLNIKSWPRERCVCFNLEGFDRFCSWCEL